MTTRFIVVLPLCFFGRCAGRELPPKIDPFKVFLVDIRVFSQWVLLVKAVLSVISYQMNNIDIITWGVLRRRGNRRLHSGILRGGAC